GVAPSECVVIEDSPTGIASARRARMRVVAVDRGHFPRSEIGDADWVVDSLDSLVGEGFSAFS
ncbi:MAG TPA: HAD hydrolase-like protein, partial [Acidimicrobiia bacterium]|nr:HAD hydrolase-like protein [Acidimicrobiia bacterium]